MLTKKKLRRAQFLEVRFLAPLLSLHRPRLGQRRFFVGDLCFSSTTTIAEDRLFISFQQYVRNMFILIVPVDYLPPYIARN